MMNAAGSIAATQETGMEGLLQLVCRDDKNQAWRCMDYRRDDYMMVMQYAILSRNPEVVNLMVKPEKWFGRGLSAEDKEEHVEVGQPCPLLLDLAIMRGDVVTLQMLLAAGAVVNASFPVVETPLHCACSNANISNRKDIIQILLERGADPNLKVYNDKTKTWLKPALVQYLASHTEPSAEIVALLLRYGSKVSMTNQSRDSDGVLDFIRDITTEEYRRMFRLLLDAAETFDLCLIEENIVINDTQKQALKYRATNPMSLLALSRISLRRYHKNSLVNVVESIGLPPILRKYLLFSRR